MIGVFIHSLCLIYALHFFIFNHSMLFFKKKLKTTGYAQFYYLLFIVLDLLTQLEKTPLFEYPPAVLIPADIQQF